MDLHETEFNNGRLDMHASFSFSLCFLLGLAVLRLCVNVAILLSQVSDVSGMQSFNVEIFWALHL